MGRPQVRLDEYDGLDEAARKMFDQNRREMMEKYLDLLARIAFDDELTVPQIEAIKKRMQIMKEVMDG